MDLTLSPLSSPSRTTSPSFLCLPRLLSANVTDAPPPGHPTSSSLRPRHPPPAGSALRLDPRSRALEFPRLQSSVSLGGGAKSQPRLATTLPPRLEKAELAGLSLVAACGGRYLGPGVVDGG
jgi:hypothetical protein